MAMALPSSESSKSVNTNNLASTENEPVRQIRPSQLPGPSFLRSTQLVASAPDSVQLLRQVQKECGSDIAALWVVYRRLITTSSCPFAKKMFASSKVTRLDAYEEVASIAIPAFNETGL